jgi:hypothetical protein
MLSAVSCVREACWVAGVVIQTWPVDFFTDHAVSSAAIAALLIPVATKATSARKTREVPDIAILISYESPPLLREISQ